MHLQAIPEYVPCQPNDRLHIAAILDQYIDGYRSWTVSKLTLDDKPFAIVQNGGRDGEDFKGLFVTDMTLFREAKRYLMSLQEEHPDFNKTLKVINPSEKSMDLTAFYTYYVKRSN
jgi:hypothetical protein